MWCEHNIAENKLHFKWCNQTDNVTIDNHQVNLKKKHSDGQLIQQQQKYIC